MQVKTGPFLRSPITIKQIMVDVLIALTPCVVAGIVFFGWPALMVLVLSSLSAVLTEAILKRASFTPKGIFGDCSALVTGLLVGLILPPTTAWWIPIVGSVLAIALVKLAFGGLGHNIFNPALGARAILLLAFTSQMVKFVVPFDTVTGATPLLSTRSFSWSLVWGNVGGSIGETSVIAILLGAIYLIYKGHINWRNPLGYVGSAFVLALIWGLDPWYTITAGGLLFAAVFMATDMVTSPVTPMGQLLFGIGCGVLTLVIRQFTPLPEGVTFAVLIMNALSPALESLTIPRKFGLSISQETRVKGIAVTAATIVILAGAFVALDRSQPAATPVISYGQHLPIAELLEDSNYEVVDEAGVRYYLVRDEDDNPAQVAFVAEQGGFNAPIRFLLVLDQEHKIQSVNVLEHKEDPGLGELITRLSFLEQFVGLDKDSSFSLGKDIQAISGATISSRALASGVSKALENFDLAFFGQEEAGTWNDGTYQASADSFGGNLQVEVVVSGGKIASVKVLAHSDTPGISDPAINGVPGRIVDANSPQVDGVSGATVTSDAIKKAVQKALEQAAGEGAGQVGAAGYAIAVADGVHRTSAQGFGGELVLDVTVSGGKITAIEVVKTAETPFIADNAFKQLLPAIIEAQGPVDTISGATVTSTAVLEAVEKAVAGSAEEKVQGAAGYAITVADGVHQASAQGFGGELVLDVTVSGGKITGIEVVKTAETPFIANSAFDQLIPAIIEAQGPVNTVSGATVTSTAVLEAVEKAVAGSSDGKKEAAVSYDITVADGVHQASVQGFGGELVLDVTVSGGKITAIEVVKTAETPFIANNAFDQLIPAIIEAQGPVNTVSGATVTSKAILEAVEKAVAGEVAEVASSATYTIEVADGVYRGSAQGFGGELVVEVTVSSGKISALEVVESSETPFIANNAIKQLVPAIIEAQGPVDAVSGATVTSGAVQEALRNALSIKEGQ
ncbi:MAG: RnfABCDGE type electron transport complex subunit D [Firmicutes bacterium]|nr:RnfABCDGE type electron transport complex subunit D [Bacillota bacterium]